TGVLWELEGDQGRLVASDGRRLAMSTGQAVAYGGHSTTGNTSAVPSKTVALLEKNLQDDGDLVRVCIKNDRVSFRTGLATISSPLLEGKFPAYRGTLPNTAPISIPLDTEPFHAAVRQAAIMADQETNRVTFHFADNKLVLRAQGRHSGR